MAAMKAGRPEWKRRAEQLAAACPRARLHPAVLAKIEVGRLRGPWFVALSGGADSVALLLLVWAHWPQARTRLQAVHFNHRLRGAAADRDERFCRQVCAALGVRIHVGRRRNAQILRNESDARAARFEHIEKVMTRQGAKVLWLGHQQNDIAESMLMRLARGSGGGGLAAPRPVQVVQGGRLHLRPLLTLKHEELTALLEAAQVPWCEDATNLTDSHFRNRIRGSVLPAWILAAGRDALAGAARTRELLEEDDAALEAWVDAAALFKAGGAMDLTKLHDRPRALARRALHRWLMRQREAGELSRQAFDSLLQSVIVGRPTRQSVGTAGFAVIRKGILKFERARRQRRNKPAGL